MFVLVSSLGTNHDLLCFVHSHGQKSEQKHSTKNFAKLHNHLPLLTMVECSSAFLQTQAVYRYIVSKSKLVKFTTINVYVRTLTVISSKIK